MIVEYFSHSNDRYKYTSKFYTQPAWEKIQSCREIPALYPIGTGKLLTAIVLAKTHCGEHVALTPHMAKGDKTTKMMLTIGSYSEYKPTHMV